MAINIKSVDETEGTSIRSPRQEVEVYEDPSMTPIPTFGDEDQFVYRWIRAEVRGDTDVNNISRRLREGWTFVKVEDLPADAMYHNIPIKSHASLDGCVRSGDRILGKLPRAKAEAYMRYVQGRTDAQARVYTQGKVKDDGSAYSFDNEGESRVIRGRKPNFDT